MSHPRLDPVVPAALLSKHQEFQALYQTASRFCNQLSIIDQKTAARISEEVNHYHAECRLKKEASELTSTNLDDLMIEMNRLARTAALAIEPAENQLIHDVVEACTDQRYYRNEKIGGTATEKMKSLLLPIKESFGTESKEDTASLTVNLLLLICDTFSDYKIELEERKKLTTQRLKDLLSAARQNPKEISLPTIEGIEGVHSPQTTHDQYTFIVRLAMNEAMNEARRRRGNLNAQLQQVQAPALTESRKKEKPETTSNITGLVRRFSLMCSWVSTPATGTTQSSQESSTKKTPSKKN